MVDTIAVCPACGQTPLGNSYEANDLGITFADTISGFDRETVICWWCRHYEMTRGDGLFTLVGPGRFLGASGSEYTRLGRVPTPAEIARDERAYARQLLRQDRAGKVAVRFSATNLELIAQLPEPDALLRTILDSPRSPNGSAHVWLARDQAGSIASLARSSAQTAREYEATVRGTLAVNKASGTRKAWSALLDRLTRTEPID